MTRCSTGKRWLGASVLASTSLVGCVDTTATDADGFGGHTEEQSSDLVTGGRHGAGGGVSAAGGQKGRDGNGGRVGTGGRTGSGGEQATGGQASGGERAAGGQASGGRSSGGNAGTGGREATGGQPSAGGGGFGGAADPGECQYDALSDACLVPIPCDETASPFGGGLGTEVSPYLICSPAQLDAVRQTRGEHLVLARSLDLSNVVDWEPIGPAGPGAFYGTFDGAGRALVGLTIEGLGLFGEIAMGSLVKNLKLLDFYVSATWSGGILAGGNAGYIENVETSGHVQGEDHLGGIVGSHYEMFDVAGSGIHSCRSSATIDGHSRIGGIVGHATMSLHEVTASGSVSGSGDYVGGVVGHLQGGYVTSSHASGDVLGRAAVGGLVGGGAPRIYGLLGGNVAYCGANNSTSSGNVTAALSAGGLVGELSGGCGVADSSATGQVSASAGTSGSGSGIGGGLVGAGAGSVKRSFATGAVSSDGVAGGLLGQLTGKWVVEDEMGWDCAPGEPCPPLVQGSGAVSRSFASGAVSSDGAAGGLVGQLVGSAAIDSSYAMGAVSGGHSVGGLVGATEASTDPTEVGAIGFSYALGIVTGGDPKGGLVGAELAPIPVTASFYFDQSPAFGPGTPLSALAFADPQSFVGWTFDGAVWAMSSELGRPVLGWE